MKTFRLVMWLMTLAVALFILIPGLVWADDGSTIYKAKCAMCHGADAKGKPAANIPSLISDEVKKMSDENLANSITQKPKHTGVAKSLSSDQVKMIISYIRSLQR